MAVEVSIPANFVQTGWGTPSVCSRHGEPAVQTTKLRFISKPPPWAYILILAGVIVFVIVAAATRKTVQNQAWPFCARCKKQRAVGLTVGLSLVVVGLILWMVGVGAQSDAAGVGFLIGLLVFFAGALVAARSGRSALAGGVVTRDGQWVQFAKASEAFAGQAGAAQQAAAQQWAQRAAAQHPYGAPAYSAQQYPYQQPPSAF